MSKSTQSEAATVAALDDQTFGEYVNKAARLMRSATKTLTERTYDAALATFYGEQRGLFGKGTDTTTKEWALRFGASGSAAASRVTLWKRLGAAAHAGVARDSETWRALVAGDLANRDGVRQAIESGDAETIRKAAAAKSQGEKTGLEEGSGRAPQTPADGPEEPEGRITSIGPKSVGDAIEILLTRLVVCLPEVAEPELVRIRAMLAEHADVVEAEGHKRIAAKSTASRKPAKGLKAVG